jgi:hypothetical protein
VVTSSRTAQTLTSPGLSDVFLCDCSDCRKITGTTTGHHNVVVLSDPPHFDHLRGEDKLTRFTISSTTTTGESVTNFFCEAGPPCHHIGSCGQRSLDLFAHLQTCGSLMYRTGSGFPGTVSLGAGTVDDFELVEHVLKPKVEHYVRTRPAWVSAAEGIRQVEGNAYIHEGVTGGVV